MRITGGMEAMAEDLPSIPLHADAEEYYREAGLLPRRPTFAQALFDWLSVTWRTLAVFLMIAADYKGIIGLKRDHAADKIYRRALASFVRPPTRETVKHFLDLRDETNERVGRRWWELGELDRARWRSLVDILNEILDDKKEGLARSLCKEAWSVARDEALDEPTRRERQKALEMRVSKAFERGELDTAQHGMLLDLLEAKKD